MELIIAIYKIIDNNIIVVEYYLFSQLDLFFKKLNNNVCLVKLKELSRYMKGLNYPFSKFERSECHRMSKLVLKQNYCGFQINVKLSKTNRRIQCSLKLDQLLIEIRPEILILKKKFQL